MIEHSGAPHASQPLRHLRSRGCRAGQETGSSQAAGDQHHRHGLAVRQMQQDLLITDWALRPSAYPSQSVAFDGALHVCVEYQQPSSTAPRLREDLDDLAVVTPLTTSRPHVLAPSRRSDKLVRQTAIIRSTEQWACDRCDRVCNSRIGLYARRKFRRCGVRLPTTCVCVCGL